MIFLDLRSNRIERRRLVRNVVDDVRDMIDKASRRFETQREQLRSTQKGDMTELEARLEKLVQRALDNPLGKLGVKI